jgi:uncharacterized protein
MTTPGKVQSLVLKVAERCNLKCTYCYMYEHRDKSYLHRPHFMSDEIFASMLARVKEYCESNDGARMELCFHGGEPTLVGVATLEKFATESRRVLGDHLAGLSMQTNATRIDTEWAEMLSRQEIKVGVSLDGPANIHDAVRVDHHGQGSLHRVLEGLRCLQEAKVLSGILCVVNPRSSGVETYRFFRSLGIRWIDYLLPDVTHDEKHRWYGDCGEEPVARYLTPIFREWFTNDHSDVRIRIFWSLLRLMFGAKGATDNFGNGAMGYLVIETDGTIHANDALRVCDEGISSSGLNVKDHSFADLAVGLPLVHRLLKGELPLCDTCQVCPERDVCGGGYVPHRYSRAREFDNPSVWCADILTLLHEMRSLVEAELAH